MDPIPDFHLAYLRTYIERDIRQLGNVSDWQLFGRFIQLVSMLSAQEINHSQLGRDLNVSPQTAHRWLALLAGTFQWIELPAFSGNSIKRLSQKPKGYVTDTGLMCFNQRISYPNAIANTPNWGAIFETAVVNNLRFQASLMATPPAFYHWHSSGGAEVAIILEWNQRLYPIEIKTTTQPNKSHTRGIQAFRALPQPQYSTRFGTCALRTVVATIRACLGVALELWLASS